MAGHFPPICYPANGWLVSGEQQEEYAQIHGRQYRKYEFHRVAGRVERDIEIYSIFALPTGTTTTSMDDVYDLSADYVHRYMGAAQVQIVLDRSYNTEDTMWILTEMAGLIEETLQSIEFRTRTPAMDEEDGE